MSVVKDPTPAEQMLQAVHNKIARLLAEHGMTADTVRANPLGALEEYLRRYTVSAASEVGSFIQMFYELRDDLVANGDVDPDLPNAEVLPMVLRGLRERRELAAAAPAQARDVELLEHQITELLKRLSALVVGRTASWHRHTLADPVRVRVDKIFLSSGPDALLRAEGTSDTVGAVDVPFAHLAFPHESVVTDRLLAALNELAEGKVGILFPDGADVVVDRVMFTDGKLRLRAYTRMPPGKPAERQKPFTADWNEIQIGDNSDPRTLRSVVADRLRAMADEFEQD